MRALFSKAKQMSAEVFGNDEVVIWGEGSLDSPVVFVGEAPGSEEEKKQKLFVGPAGKFLSSELENACIKRNDIYITAVVKIRTKRINNGRIANRTPNQFEVQTWKNILYNEIEIIKPILVVCLGSIAASTLIHANFEMKRERGIEFEGPFGIRTIATYHPAYVRRFKGKSVEQFRNDLLIAKNILNSFI